jgi:hypothetical protein
MEMSPIQKWYDDWESKFSNVGKAILALVIGSVYQAAIYSDMNGSRSHTGDWKDSRTHTKLDD